MPKLNLSPDPALPIWPTTGIVGILDLEYTAWEGSAHRHWSEDWEWREIVQIGFLLVDVSSNFSIIKGIELMVKPSRNPILSDYFTSLTGITMEDLEQNGLTLAGSMEKLNSFVGDIDMIIFNGHDGEVLRENCKNNNINLPWKKELMFDFRPLLSSSLEIPVSKLISSDLPQLAGVSFPGQAHTALYDCMAIASAFSVWRDTDRI